MPGPQIHCWALLGLFCRQIYYPKLLWAPASMAGETEKGWKNNFHPWWPSWRQTGGASGLKLRIRDVLPSLLQDIVQGPPIAGDGWRGRRLPTSLTKQLFKKIGFSTYQILKDRIISERIGGEKPVSPHLWNQYMTIRLGFCKPGLGLTFGQLNWTQKLRQRWWICDNGLLWSDDISAGLRGFLCECHRQWNLAVTFFPECSH